MRSWFEEDGMVAIFDPDPVESRELERACGKLNLHRVDNDLGWLVLSSKKLDQGTRTTGAPLELALWKTPTREGADTSSLRISQGSATLRRAASGLPAVHFARTGRGRLVISTRLGWLALFACRSVKVDGLIMLMQSIGWPAHPDNRGVIQGVFTLGLGEATTITAAKSARAVVSTWSAPAAPIAAEDAPRRILAALRRYLSFHLPASGNLLLYSGGLDSAAIDAVARRLLGKALDRSTRSIPFHFEAAGREFFYLSGGGRGQWTHRVCGENVTQETDILRAPPDFCPAGGHIGLVHHARRHYRKDFRTLVLGWGADELFGVLRFADWVTTTRPHQLWRLLDVPERHRLARWWLQRRASRRHGLHLPLSLRPYVALPLREEYLDFRRSQQPARGREPWAQRLSHLRRFGDWMGPIWESTAALRLELIAPFTALDMVKIGYETHPQELFRAGLAKQPLRAAVRHLLPLDALSRMDDGDWRVPIAADRPLPQLSSLVPSLDIQWIERHPSVDVGTALELQLLSKVADAPARVEHERKVSQIPRPTS